MTHVLSHLCTSISPEDTARLLAVSTIESSAWLHVLPIASVGLKLDDEAVRVGVGFAFRCPFV